MQKKGELLFSSSLFRLFYLESSLHVVQSIPFQPAKEAVCQE